MLNFFVQKQNILEITSNFRINFDLFEFATFDTNYGLQAANQAITGCTKVALRYFRSFPAISIWSTLWYFLVTILLSKMSQEQKSNGLRSGDFYGRCVVEMKWGTSFLSHSGLTRAEFCWNVQGSKCLSAQGFNTDFKIFSRQ